MSFGLLDCNNFYVSCQRVFNPSLIGKPVVVLSNNDGCVIARSDEVKKLGIKMGVPAYQIKEEIRKYGITVFSSNYTLFGDMSARVMSLLSTFVEEVEIYSIDEAFVSFEGFDRYDLYDYGREIVRTITKGTGIPVSLGIAPTKTLAKVANKFAKKYPNYKGVCIIDSEEKREKALKLFDIGDVWGIGHRNAAKLDKISVKTAFDFTQVPIGWVRKNMTVVGERTWRELRGESCIDMELIAPDKKQICTSRAFGTNVTGFDELSQAVALYAGICASKLRKQKSCALSLMVFIHTNNFRNDLPQYYCNRVVKLPVPTSDTSEITHYALLALRDIYRTGYLYKKAGVIITELCPANAVQGNLFDAVDREKSNKLMEVMDSLNHGFNNKLVLASQFGGTNWKLKQENLSPCYTTRLQDIINIKTK